MLVYCRKHLAPESNQQGLSLVELLIALALSST
ncbi:prepilin-type N-terminal cleavage/methylation domain-containing protein [Marinobacter similis]|uniref:Prepilin-type N-terminal cleavage/methylation domain-containing protein n=1 Tax=Marinobacter similis TaxID=1420916 RepID=W5YM42_9GAMM|nr:prepilin-type N-terminal cleavage/methylation domain-containing protein [Marinobacter similis]AHI30171.1 hypothetical protein AU14_14125 [Marinobacter similis]